MCTKNAQSRSVKIKQKTKSNRHHSNRGFGGLRFCGFLRRSGTIWGTVASLRICSGALGLPGTTARSTFLAPWTFGVWALGASLGAGSSCTRLHVVTRVKAGRQRRREIAASDIFIGRNIFHGTIEVGSLIHKKIIIITVLIAAAEIDDIVMVWIWHNSIRVGILRVLGQFRIASFRIID